MVDHNIERLIEKIKAKEIIVWAGSGFSLYAGYPKGTDFCKILIDFAKDEEGKSVLSNKPLMDTTNEFEQLYSREVLIDMITKTFMHKPTSYPYAHKLISKIPYFNTIITTNYDQLFELAYGPKINISIGTALIKTIDGKIDLYKIHGDTTAPSSVVITSKDYACFYDKLNSLFWSKIKVLLSEKSVLFIGYSLEDKNIQDIFEKVLNQIDTTSTEFFIVTPELKDYKLRYFNSICKTTHIPMKGEELIHIIEKETRETIIEDAVRKKIGTDEAYLVCHEKGIDVTFRNLPDGNTTKIQLENYQFNSIGTLISQGFKLSSNAQNYEELSTFINDCDCKDITIPSKDVTLFNNIKGINLPKNISNNDNTSVFKLCKEERQNTIQILAEDGKVIIESAKMLYEWGKVKNRITISTQATKLIIEHNNNEVTIIINLIYPHSAELIIKELNYYINFTKTNSIKINELINNAYHEVCSLKIFSAGECIDFISEFCLSNIGLYGLIQTIENDINEQIIIDHLISHDENIAIKRAVASLTPQIIPMNSEMVLNLSIEEYKKIEKGISSDKFPIILSNIIPEDIIELFGKNLVLGRRKWSILNPEISNREELKAHILKGEMLPVKIISKSKEKSLEYISV